MVIKGQRFGIMGFARSGISTAQKILEYGGIPFISEIKTESEIREDIITGFGLETWQNLSPYCEFGQHSDRLLECDTIIVSPGIPSDHFIIQRAAEHNINIISEIELGYQIKDRTSKIIAVTGSNGKSTTVSLIYHILQNAGYKAVLAGNIGSPITSYPIDKPGIDYLILELSSFQLELTDTFLPDIAIFLNLTPDHLDRHQTLDNYLTAKMKIFMNQDSRHKAVLNADDTRIMSCSDRISSQKTFFACRCNSITPNFTESACLSNSKIVWNRNESGNYDEYVFETDKSHLLGLHNRQNMMASILAVSKEVKDKRLIQNSLNTFLPLPHRLERISEIRGITFINDSKATNTESVKQAITAFDKPIHLILGGYDKGENYTILLPYLNERVKRIYLIGNSREKMELAFQSLRARISIHRTLFEAVNRAYRNAGKEEVVLLSPACASYDMYKNFEQRGEAFRTIVKELEKDENRL